MELVEGHTGGLPESSSPDGQTVAYTVAGARPDIQARPTQTPAAIGAAASRGKSERGKGLAHCRIRAGGRKALPYTPDKSGPSMASTGPSHGRSQSVADRAPQNSARKGKKSLDRFSASLFATSENGPRRGLERA
jgi:hypothetical protein